MRYLWGGIDHSGTFCRPKKDGGVKQRRDYQYTTLGCEEEEVGGETKKSGKKIGKTKCAQRVGARFVV